MKIQPKTPKKRNLKNHPLIHLGCRFQGTILLSLTRCIIYVVTSYIIHLGFRAPVYCPIMVKYEVETGDLKQMYGRRIDEFFPLLNSKITNVLQICIEHVLCNVIALLFTDQYHHYTFPTIKHFKIPLVHQDIKPPMM